jgi:diguanylate cyclase (GGDEF)-like protein
LDESTQVLRKPIFDYLFELEVKKAVRYQYFLTVLFLEVDGAEPAQGVDGQHGVIAELLRDELRATDVIGRLTEERFSILLHHADDANTQRIGERLRRRIADYVFAQGQEGRRTVSIGGACFPTSGNYPEDLLSEAHRMLQRAQQDGGNKVYLSPCE